MKNKIILLLALLAIGTVSVFVLPDSTQLVSSSGFYRHFPPNLLSESKLYELGNPFYYIAGYTSKAVFLANRQHLDSVGRMTLELDDLTQTALPLPKDKKLVWSAVRIRVDSPMVYFTEHISRYFFSSIWGAGQRSKSGFIDLKPQQLLPISVRRIVSKVYDPTLSQNVLQTVDLEDTRRARPARYILEKQVDGVFCTDGVLRYDPGSGLLLYVYHYRNRFLLLDQNLKALLVGKTIDTTGHVNFSVGSFSKNATMISSFSTPPKLVNSNAFFNSQYIFVVSALISENENPSDFRKTSVIDIYRIDGDYLYSVKVPDLKEEKVRDFIVSGDRLVLLYKSTLLSYKLRLP